MTAPLIDPAARARFNRLLGEEAAERVRLLNGDREAAYAKATTESFEDSKESGYVIPLEP